MLHFIPQHALIYADISLQSDFFRPETNTKQYSESVDTLTCLVQIVHYNFTWFKVSSNMFTETVCRLINDQSASVWLFMSVIHESVPCNSAKAQIPLKYEWLDLAYACNDLRS